MDFLQVGFVEALYKVIEERIPGGRAITTATSVLVVLTIIVFAVNYLVETLAPMLIATASYGHSIIVGLTSNKPTPSLVQRFKFDPFFREAILNTIMFGGIVLYVIFSEVDSERSQKHILQRLADLEKIVGAPPVG
jgi:hypothetical protein